jgi:hypothetical protein
MVDFDITSVFNDFNDENFYGVSMDKLSSVILKVPFQNIVITQEGYVYRYGFYKKKPRFSITFVLLK